jgi:8-oxo-dGTP diphosphatase
MKNKDFAKNLIFDLDQLVPGQSIDCVIMGFDQNKLKILVLKWKVEGDFWALPGGFVFKEEDLDKAAIRVLKERTGIELPFLEQFKTFGNIQRRNSDILVKNLKSIGLTGKLIDWFNQRFITTGYLSLVDIQKCDPKPDFSSEMIKWASLDELPDLIFDHNDIVKTALDFIKNRINYLPIGITLLPEKFTMKSFQSLYESILQKKLDRGNFQRKMLKLDIFIRHEKQLEGGAHKAPYLYSFDEEKYKKLLEQGYGFYS